MGKPKKTLHYVAQRSANFPVQQTPVGRQSRRFTKGEEIHEIIDDRGSDLSSSQNEDSIEIPTNSNDLGQRRGTHTSKKSMMEDNKLGTAVIG